MAQAAVSRGEVELLANALRGDNEALRAFFERYNPLIRSCVRKGLRRYGAKYTADDFDDMVADVWLALFKDDRKKLRLYDPQRGFKVSTWLGLIATNNTIDELRRRRCAIYLEESPEISRLATNDPSPYSAVERCQEQRLAERALERLPSKDRTFLIACYERSSSDLAGELGVSLNTIYTRKFKIRAKLSKIVARLTRPPLQPIFAQAA